MTPEQIKKEFKRLRRSICCAPGEILESEDIIEGESAGNYKLGVIQSSGQLFTVDPDGNWILFTGGGAGSQNLQQTLDIGNSATGDNANISLMNENGIANIGTDVITVQNLDSTENAYLRNVQEGFVRFGNGDGNINADISAENHEVGDMTKLVLPRITGVATLSVNGVPANDNGDISLAIPDTSGFIPISGTVSGNPVTGSIEFESDNGNKIFASFDNKETGYTTNGYNGRIYSNDQLNSFGSAVQTAPEFVSIDSTAPLPRGLVGLHDYTANIQDLDFVQKKYVDGSFIPLQGTFVNAPVTGDIEVNNAGNKQIFAYERDEDDELTGGFGQLYVAKNLVDIGFQNLTTSLFKKISIATDNTLPAIQITDRNNDGSLGKGLSGVDDYTPNITDLDYVQKKYVDGAFVPLAGTQVGSPITGSIQFTEIGDNLYNDNSENHTNIDLNDQNVIQRVFNKTTLKTMTTSLSNGTAGGAGLEIDSDDPTARGLIGVHDYSANVTDLDYPQEIYVIPRSGTKVGKAVTGDLELGDNTNSDISIKNLTGAYDQYLSFLQGDGLMQLRNKLKAGDEQGLIQINGNTITLNSRDVASNTIQITVADTGVEIVGDTQSNSDIEITDFAKGIIMKSPDGTRYRLTVLNGGTLDISPA